MHNKKNFNTLKTVGTIIEKYAVQLSIIKNAAVKAAFFKDFKTVTYLVRIIRIVFVISFLPVFARNT